MNFGAVVFVPCNMCLSLLYIAWSLVGSDFLHQLEVRLKAFVCQVIIISNIYILVYMYLLKNSIVENHWKIMYM